MSKFKEMIFMAFIAVGLTSFTTTIESANSELGTGGTVCKSINTDCGNGQWSHNRACTTYNTANDRPQAIAAAAYLAGEAGRAACDRMGSIKNYTITIER